MSFCTALTVSLNCLAMACPRNDSTLKLLVLVGNIMNATTVVSLFSDCIQTIKSQQSSHRHISEQVTTDSKNLHFELSNFALVQFKSRVTAASNRPNAIYAAKFCTH